MDKNKIIGIGLVIAAAALACAIASSDGGAAGGLIGKAVWYLPYVALVGGVRCLARVRWQPRRRTRIAAWF